MIMVMMLAIVAVINRVGTGHGGFISAYEIMDKWADKVEEIMAETPKEAVRVVKRHGYQIFDPIKSGRWLPLWADMILID